MPFDIKKAQVWACDMPNRPGTLGERLDALATAGANLEFVVARRHTEDTSRAFFAPIKGKKQTDAAKRGGLQPAQGMHVLRIEGPDKAGLGAYLTSALGAGGINLRGLSAASVGKRSICYTAFATPEDAKAAAKILKKALAQR